MAFGAADLQPSLLNEFSTAVARNWLIHRKPVISNLRHHNDAGAHTDIYLLEPGPRVTRYTWSHVINRPFGKPAPPQCTRCGSPTWGDPQKTFKDRELVTIVLRCLFCKRNLKKAFEKGSLQLVTRSGNGNSKLGDWYSEAVNVL
jgi:hypothetical protein